jgi:hypothetical protein
VLYSVGPNIQDEGGLKDRKADDIGVKTDGHVDESDF